jgi:cytochrome c oxidase cbb3-type subunit 3
MSDFVSGFWDMYVRVIVLVSVLGCGVFLWMQSKGAPPVAAGAEAEKMSHIWDETLQEYNNPLPVWWSYLFYITVVFSLVYLVLYPGFGSYPGVLGWSSHGSQYDTEMKAAEATYGPIFEKFAKQDIKAVATNPEAKQMGERLFLTYCSQCHGSDGKGAKGFPNLADNDWLYGGTPEKIETTIMEGRMGVMPAWGPQLGAEGVKDVANYVRSLSGMAVDSVRAGRGKDIFTTNCAACHGPDGKGNQAIGAPNLTDHTWLYGSSEATVIETITKGRTNQMPTWKNFLGQAKVHLLTAYVYGLSPTHEEEPAAPAPVAAPADAAAAPAEAAPAAPAGK